MDASSYRPDQPKGAPAHGQINGLPRERYRLIQYHFTQFFIEHLCDVSRVFEGDLQEMLVLAVLGQAYLRADELGRDNASINACRIAETTGIPRQTVRRKLQSLRQRGWAHQIEGGAWRLSVEDSLALAQQGGLADLDKRGTDRILKFARTVKPHI